MTGPYDPGSDAPSLDQGATRVKSPVAVFDLQGELNGSRAAKLRAELSGAVGERAVLLDLTEVAFIDPVGLGVLLGAIRQIHDRGGMVAIVAADPRRGIARGLQTSGVDGLVVLADSRAEALRRLDDPDTYPAVVAGQMSSEWT